MTTPQNTHRWRFFRAGGFDQVRLDRAEDLLHLDQLDQKLWVALSCPIQGLEFDRRTLELIDTDRDGHIRAPELIAALHWTGALLKDKALLGAGAATLPLDAIDDSSEEGRQVLAAARRILQSLGKGEAASITPADTSDIAAIFAAARFNGDGIVTPANCQDEALAALVQDIMERIGSDTDRSGEPGVSQAQAERFLAEAKAWCEWQAAARQDGAVLPLGEATAAARDAVAAVRAKVEDYFTRCRLAAFDPRAGGLMNGAEDDLKALATRNLEAGDAAIAALPLARIEAGRPLPLEGGLNPAWSAAVATLASAAVTPLLGQRQALTEADWQALLARLQAHEDWLAARVETPVAELGLERLQAILAGDLPARLLALIAEDAAVAPEFEAISSADRLVHYVRDLALLANNFVSFRDFYTRRGKAMFQAGTLYLDGRSCELVIPVNDAAKHAALAGLSRICLVYCDCQRGGEKLSIAAAFTAGDSDQLLVGRNGVFYDRQGRDWNATISKIVDHPISIRQAFWSPYRKVARMIGEQFQKFAAAKAAAVEQQSASLVADGAKKVEGAPSAPAAPAAAKPAPTPFDVGKFAGIFAALGLAVGAIGTAIASVVTGFLGLSWWQMPIAVAGLMLMVSGPSMLLAWFKLRSRTLGPLLDANGWAVNARARINIPFGTALTQLAKLPDGAERALTDPYADKRRVWPWALTFLVLLAVFAWVVLRGHV